MDVSTFLFAFCLGFKRLIRFFFFPLDSSCDFSEPSFVSGPYSQIIIYPLSYPSLSPCLYYPLKEFFFLTYLLPIVKGSVGEGEEI